MKRRRINTRGLICRVTDGKNNYISPEISLYKKIQNGTITEEELHIYVELTHTNCSRMTKVIKKEITISVFGRTIVVTEEQFRAHCKDY